MHIAYILSLLASLSLSFAFYKSSGPVYTLNHNNFYTVLAKEPIAIVEFFAPWCGHCKSLADSYVKVAENLMGMVKIAAIDCDDDNNKPICAQNGIQGFPTIKLFKNGKAQEDYQGPRTAKAIADYVVEHIPNFVKKVTDDDFEQFLSEKNNTLKVGLFTQKGTTSGLWKSLALNFKDKAIIFQVRDNQNSVLELFGVETFPTIIALPGGDSPAVTYTQEELKAPALNTFVKSFLSSDEETSSKSEIDTPKSNVAELTFDVLESLCLTKSSKAICAIAFLPSYSDSHEEWLQALENAVGIAQKLNVKNFQFFWTFGSLGERLLEILHFDPTLPAMVALNGRRGWVREFEGDFNKDALQDFILATKNGDGKRDKLDIDKVLVLIKGDSSADEPTKESIVMEDTLFEHHDEL